MDLDLFLAHADDNRPVLAEGLPWSAARGAPAPAPVPPAGGRHAGAAPPDDLVEQGWAVIAPRGAAGDRLLRLIEPLRRAREEQQGVESIVYRVDPGMDPISSAAWAQQDYWDAVGRREDRLPRYLLLLGGADAVSWDLQQVLGGEAFVGRLAFPDERGYEAYVEKVQRWEREEPAPGARALFYTVRDGTPATSKGYKHLMRPSLAIACDRRERGRFSATEVVEIGGDGSTLADDPRAGGEEMLREAGRARAGLLFSMSHGAGAPRAGWSSPEAQRAAQGAMVLGRSGDRVGARDIEGRPFLPGGAWFFFACYGAGTPARSAYHPWLERLHKLGRYGAAGRVLAALPQAGDPPFVAALPQAALASPTGPLGVIGHVDLAWTWSFLENDISSAGGGVQRRAERFQGILRALVEGHRLGVAHHELTRFSRPVSAALCDLYEEDARGGVAEGGVAAHEAREARRAGLWMQRQDLCAYVLLGDPAARLPIARLPAGVEPPKGPARAPLARPTRR